MLYYFKKHVQSKIKISKFLWHLKNISFVNIIFCKINLEDWNQFFFIFEYNQI